MRRFILPLLAVPALAADLLPDKGNTIPESGKRPVVVNGKSSQALPKHDLPDGYTLELAAAAPLVTHPIMGCLDDKGRLFVGDGVGVNWNKKQLEENPPNRVLMLEDTDNDGTFDKSTVFADKMTFPQGACWLNGSLYVCSPPGLWKLTDTNNDGVADQREMIVGGFEYTGNAADVHGPFLHPNGRLYWCHGRKGHDVKQKDGTPVDASLACGIWSCKPDGSDVAWHSLGCGDNPVEVDFTRNGDIIGVQNLYYSQPRGDTIIHWLYGGVYERPDQLKAIAHLPRTLETMPVMYNFGHVAVSGCCFWRSYPTKNQEPRTQNFLVTHFNTQRLVRMELTPEGSTYKAVENEFLKLHNPDIHLTDVMEDPRDGSLLLIDTGGWFRIGCPSSLMAKSDLLGAVYRIKPKKPLLATRSADAPVRRTDIQSQIEALNSTDMHERRQALEEIARASRDAQFLSKEDWFKQLASSLDPSLEHAVIHACSRFIQPGQEGEFLGAALARHNELGHVFMARALKASLANVKSLKEYSEVIVHLSALSDKALVEAAVSFAVRDHEIAKDCLEGLMRKIAPRRKTVRDNPDVTRWIEKNILPNDIAQIERLLLGTLHTKEGQKTVASMLSDDRQPVLECVLRVLASQSAVVCDDDWLPSLDRLLAMRSPSPLVLDAIKKLKSPHFDTALQAIANDTKRPLAIRLKALDSAKSVKLTGETFDMVKNVLADAGSSSAAKIQAAGMLSVAPMTKEQMPQIAPLLATVGPVELKTLLPLLKRHKDVEIAKTLAHEIAKNPTIASQQESLYRTALADLPPEIFETIILPAYNTAVAATEAKKRQLGPLADKVIASGNAANGEKHFKVGKGTCIACHKIGDVGRPIGPDLSHIGAIRTERDLLESILFPSNTLARDYEAHVIETSDGQQTLGVIKSHTAEGLLVADIAGQEKTIAHQMITGDTTLATSLMPMGLDQTMPEAELLDLVAWLRSLK
jgi:putative membrane-bound dehydrogenase-like protein|uniref:PVC-type heme-binding CxxCH protein n=1 Tax=Prosthecobacter sp. TaxID=1965333 RepID=UPI0037842620